MKYRILPALVLAVPFVFASAQQQAASAPVKPSISQDLDSVELQIEKPVKMQVSEALIRRIFQETVQEVVWHLNPKQPPTVQAKVTLRLGQRGDTVEITEGKERLTVICMRNWDGLLFARMVARVARSGLLTDQELDALARTPLARAGAAISLKEIQ